MLTEQDITQIASLIASNNQQLSAMMDNKFQAQKQDILAQMAVVMMEQTETLSEIIESSETRISIKIENEVTKEIRALFDGYKTVREAQWELEHKVNTLVSQIDEIRNSLTLAGIAV